MKKKAKVKVKATQPLIWLFRTMTMRIKLLVKTKMMTKMKKVKKKLLVVAIRKLLKRRVAVRISTVLKAKTWAYEDLTCKGALMTLSRDTV